MTRGAYYNEFDPFAAAWLRELIKKGHIAAGDVDERSILDVSADDLKGYAQCHFFAGIGGWSYALRLAGWPDDRPVWTGSCPCQPFSPAGKKKGKTDARHLLPAWLDLIRKCHPATIFGEQVERAVAHGWLDDVYQGLEAESYTVGAAVLPACSGGAPHKRDRLWFVAHSENDRPHKSKGENRQQASAQIKTCGSSIAGVMQSGPMADPISERGRGWHDKREDAADAHTSSEEGVEWIECPDGKWRSIKPGLRLLAHGVPNRVGKLCGYGNAIVPQVAAEFIKACEGANQ
jgi:DNA (cytosine-5)-methyltransferase 1